MKLDGKVFDEYSEAYLNVHDDGARIKTRMSKCGVVGSEK